MKHCLGVIQTANIHKLKALISIITLVRLISAVEILVEAELYSNWILIIYASM